ncbi:zinc ABC transporter solute-binding protein [Virgibacillus sp. MSP4-1]|uniref:metal ABC transporter solute-binding protein, Zn/Mn family n=1 Tax=Virgibacillus sp. MSP4-1 TaxID=2700081 RepID=UPI0003A5595D|nr:zinc ABC transporter substrate-binding protein [Virgibacillus sp. MSP4-1]QHS22481.1 zinc ABC transporter solute-binding protein [Virgibacillus sp. MSP4-1]
MRHLVRSIIILVVFIPVITACTQGENQANKNHTDKISIYTTLYPIEDFTRKIGGEYVEVTNLLSDGMDPHTYEPTSKTIVEIAQSDLFMYSGAGLEAYAEKISKAVESEEVLIVEAAKDVGTVHHGHGKEVTVSKPVHESEEEDSHHNHQHGDKDPHVWLDPLRSIDIAETIKESLISVKPEHKKFFQKNFQELKANLEALDSKFHNVIRHADRKQFVVSHAAYGYWEEAYGIKQIGISGMNQNSELSQKELTNIINEVKEQQIDYLLFENTSVSNVAQLIKDEVGATVLPIHNLSVRTREEIQNQDDYFSLMRKNLESLSTALND